MKLALTLIFGFCSFILLVFILIHYIMLPVFRKPEQEKVKQINVPYTNVTLNKATGSGPISNVITKGYTCRYAGPKDTAEWNLYNPGAVRVGDIIIEKIVKDTIHIYMNSRYDAKK